MPAPRSILMLIAFVLSACGSSPKRGAGKGGAAPTIETLRLTSRTFGNTRTIRVLLPPSYHERTNARRRYPVLFLNDGVMVFKTSAIDVATVVGDAIDRGDIPPILIAGIDNGASTDHSANPETDRAMEYLPYPDTGSLPAHTYAAEPADPKGRSCPAFLVDEVVPEIRACYRTMSDPDNTGLGGFCLRPRLDG